MNIPASSDQNRADLGLFKSSKLGLSNDIVLCDLAEWMALVFRSVTGSIRIKPDEKIFRIIRIARFSSG